MHYMQNYYTHKWLLTTGLCVCVCVCESVKNLLNHTYMCDNRCVPRTELNLTKSPKMIQKLSNKTADSFLLGLG